MKNTLIDSVRLARKEAREMLRAIRINSVTQKLNRAKGTLAFREGEKARFEKSLAVEEYEKSVLDADHPLYTEKVTIKDAYIVYIKKCIEDATANMTEAKAKVERIEAFIKKVADGEVKMSLESINQIAAEKLAKI